MNNAFSPEAYRHAVTDYDHTWRTTDQTLYDLCRHHPGHSDQADVNAKLWIIGRTYATGIERKIPTKNTQGSSMGQLARYILDHPAEVKAIFEPLARLAEPLRADMLPTIIEQHGRFVRFLQRLTRKRQSPRAFCSKYMHFHCPVVPIIDSFAYRAVRGIQPWQENFQLFSFGEGVDEEYGWYVFRFWQLYREAIAAGLTPTVKHLDHYLLCTAENTA